MKKSELRYIIREIIQEQLDPNRQPVSPIPTKTKIGVAPEKPIKGPDKYFSRDTSPVRPTVEKFKNEINNINAVMQLGPCGGYNVNCGAGWDFPWELNDVESFFLMLFPMFPAQSLGNLGMIPGVPSYINPIQTGIDTVASTAGNSDSQSENPCCQSPLWALCAPDFGQQMLNTIINGIPQEFYSEFTFLGQNLDWCEQSPWNMNNPWDIQEQKNPLNTDGPKNINPEIIPTDKKLAGPDKVLEPDKKPGKICVEWAGACNFGEEGECRFDCQEFENQISNYAYLYGAGPCAANASGTQGCGGGSLSGTCILDELGGDIMEYINQSGINDAICGNNSFLPQAADMNEATQLALNLWQFVSTVGNASPEVANDYNIAYNSVMGTDLAPGENITVTPAQALDIAGEYCDLQGESNFLEILATMLDINSYYQIMYNIVCSVDFGITGGGAITPDNIPCCNQPVWGPLCGAGGADLIVYINNEFSNVTVPGNVPNPNYDGPAEPGSFENPMVPGLEYTPIPNVEGFAPPSLFNLNILINHPIYNGAGMTGPYGNIDNPGYCVDGMQPAFLGGTIQESVKTRLQELANIRKRK